MARTLDFKGQLEILESGVLSDLAHPSLTGNSITHYLRTVRTLSTHMLSTDSLDFGDGFTTATFTYVASDAGTFTVSLNTSTKPQVLASGGFMLFNGNVTAVHLQNNSLTVKPVATVILAG